MAYKVVIGGRWGKKTALAQPLGRLLTSDEAVLDTLDKIILFYKSNGNPGERFAETIARIGMENVAAQVL